MKRLSARQLVTVMVLIADVLLCAIYINKNEQQQSFMEKHISTPGIQRICELATLECFYHNVGEWGKAGNLVGYGAKKTWVEYDGSVRVGVKGDKIKVSDPDQDNVITVMIPAATVLSKDLDEGSIHGIDSESSLWGFIPLYDHVTVEDRKNALAKAQEDMENSLLHEGGKIFIEAQERAKMIIERNIVALGEASGKHYKVRFIDAAETQNDNSGANK